MSRDIEIRFRGIVKKEFRELFEPIALYGKWTESSDEKLREFGECYDRPQRIPLADYAGKYAVKRWNTEEWDHKYDKESGLWQFRIGINMYSDGYLIVDFDDEIVPYVMEEVSHYERWVEPIGDDPYDEITVLCELVDGEIEPVGVYDENGVLLLY